MRFFQKLGKSLMLPVAVLPVCGILMGLGYLLCPAAMQGGEIITFFQKTGFLMVKAGGAVIDNISWLFALGVAVGMSDDNHGASAICGLVSWLMVITLLAPGTVEMIRPSISGDSTVKLAFEKIGNPFIAILTGLIGAFSYNQFRKTELPDYLAFFSGRRFSVIISAVLSTAMAVILCFIWPATFSGLVSVGQAISSMGAVGAGVHAFLNRLLIPLGLHHALNNVFWFDTIGIGDLTAFWAGKTSADVGWSLGMYMSGFFAPTMFGIAGAAIALYRNSEKKGEARSILVPAVICAFVSGITEPFEFLFMFLSFPLYVIYAALYGIFTIIAYYSGFRAGFSFSSGIIDLIFSSSLPAAQRTLMILPIGLAAGLVFYLAFSFFIRIFHVKFLDNADETAEVIVKKEEIEVRTENNSIQESSMSEQAAMMVSALGGQSNIKELSCCATRLRLELIDTKKVDQNMIKMAGGIAFISMGDTSCQVIVGTKVQQLCDEMNKEKMMTESENREKIIKISATGLGTAAGPVFRVGNSRTVSSSESVLQGKTAGSKSAHSPEEEWSIYTAAVKSAGEKLTSSGSGDMNDVMNSYAMFLEDPDSMEEAHRAVFEDGLSSLEAAERAGKYGSDMLASLNDDYLRSRADDVVAAFEYLKRELDGGGEKKITRPSIIVGAALMPTDIVGIDRSDILAIVTGKGSQTSHLAIIARGMGIPYITCSDSAVMGLKDGTCVIVDTDRGEIIIEPGRAALTDAIKRMEERQQKERETEENIPDVELPVKLYANIESPAELEEVLRSGAEGIGLFRSEFLFLNRDKAPDEDEQFEAYRAVVEGMKGKPVIIRTSDIGTDKMPSYMPPAHEENPALGKRAIRISLTEPEAFRVQLRALLRAACFGNEKIMYPMITSVHELELLRQQLELAAKELEERGERYRIPPCGIMIETPAAAMTSDTLAEKVDFFSIGTNDLTQYTLALDRQGEGLDMFYDPHHEGILRLIELTAKNAHAAGIEIGICGELGADTEMAERFIGIGIDELSMSVASLPRVRRILAGIVATQDKTYPVLAAPVDGILISMEEIPDPVFSAGTLGKCFAVKPDNGMVYAPCSGQIVNIAETKHAFTVRTESGSEILVHVGIDTVKLGGKGFTVMVKEGQMVSCGDFVMEADMNEIRAAGYDTMVITVLLE